MRLVAAFAALAAFGVTLPSGTAKAAAVPLFDRLQALASAFPDRVKAIEIDAIVMSDGTRIPIDDGKTKDHEGKLENADIEDMLSQIYPVGSCDTGAKPARNEDPGRIRNDAFFKSAYGSSEKAVRTHLAKVDWFGKPLAFTTVAGADKALAAVARDLSGAGPELMKHLVPSAGTLNWRVVAGTRRLSAHSFGAAIDLNAKLADYWRWSGGKPGNVPSYKNRMPKEIVDVFESHGFIWGGKWYHYDTMHFEYRPELIAIGRLAADRGCPAE
nr:M15 family metallopeptidase [Aurantimonas sp. VKM B-3413]